MKYLQIALVVVFCIACLVVTSCSELDGNLHDEKSSNYTGGGDDTTSTPVITRFNVIFHTNGGTPIVIDPVTVDSGTALGEKYPANPTKSGNIFDGWFDGAEQYAASTIITKNVQLLAQWNDTTSTTAVRQFAVAFHTNGGSPSTLPPVIVDSGATLAGRYPEEPLRLGHDFGGWFDGETEYTASTVIFKGVTLTAKWNPIPVKQVTVTFNTNGGTPAAIEPITIDSGTTLGSQLPAPPTMDGHTFVGWLDGVELYSASTVITRDVTLTANWNEEGGNDLVYYTLTVSAGAGGGGTVTRDPDQATYLAGTTVTVRATEMTGYLFMGWLGASTSTNNEITVTMSGNISLTANFHQITYYTVAVNIIPTGAGTVARDPPSISYPAGTQVILTATPAAGYRFSGWTGVMNEPNTAIMVTMNSDLTLTANFEPVVVTYTLTTTVTPSSAGGTVSRSPDETSYLPGTAVTVTAEREDGYRFVRWSGASTSTDSSVTITINNDTTLTANFELITYTLTTITNPSGSGTVLRDPDLTIYMPGTEVTLTPIPADGYVFNNWEDVRGSLAERTVTINNNITLTANFQLVYLKDTRDDKAYRILTIGERTWMAENLNFETNNSLCYDDEDSNCETYGRLYTWDAAMSACPSGWQLPNRDDWTRLINAGNGPDSAGERLKSRPPDWNGTDQYDFSALPGGGRHPMEFPPGYNFLELKEGGYWWSATPAFWDNTAYYFGLKSDSVEAAIYDEEHITKDFFFSVRCVKQ